MSKRFLLTKARKAAAVTVFSLLGLTFAGSGIPSFATDIIFSNGQSETSVALTAGLNTMTVNNTDTGTIQAFTGSGTLVKAGTGILRMDNTSLPGPIQLNAGTILIGTNTALGTWTQNATFANSTGQVTLNGVGTVMTDADRTIQNRFLIGYSDTTSALTFNIASGTSLTINDVINTATDTSGYGGAISMNGMSSSPAFIGGGGLVLEGNSAKFGGAFSSVSTSRNAGADFSGLSSLSFIDNYTTTGQGGSGGAVYASSSGSNTTNLIFGDDVLFSGNTSVLDGGAIYAYGNNNVNITFGDMVSFVENSTARFGGAIYALSTSTTTNSSIILGQHTLFKNNNASGGTARSGGAIYASRNLTVSGNTYFTENRTSGTDAFGGAIYMRGVAAGSLVFDTTTGAIAFSGNTDSTGANSVYLNRMTSMQIMGVENIYFNDPIRGANAAGNQLILGQSSSSTGSAFSGLALFSGGMSTLSNNFIIDIGQGTLHHISGSGFDGGTGYMKLETQGTLAGSGKYDLANFLLSGTISPDSYVYDTPGFDEDTNTFASATAPSGSNIGTITLDGTVTMSGATLAFDAESASSYDHIDLTGSIAFGADDNTVALSGTWDAGTYDLITTTGGIQDITGNFAAFSGVYARSASLQLAGAGDLILRLVIGAATNTTLTWTGVESANWVPDDNWTDVPGSSNPTITAFANGDRVIFDTAHTIANSTVAVTEDVVIADMTVSGSGNYTINTSDDGYKIETGASSLTDASGKLAKTGSGTLTMGGENTFSGGITINGGTLIAKSAVAIGGGAVINNTTLQFNSAGTDTFGQNISGAGQLVMNGTGDLTLTGTNTYTGPTSVNSGELIGNIANNTALTVAGGATYNAGSADRTVSSLNGTGAVDMNSNSLMVSSGDFSGGEIENAETITKTGTGTFTIGQTEATNLVLTGGTLIIAEDASLILSDTADIGAGTTLGIGVGDGVNPSLIADGTITIDNTATINITGYSGTKMLLMYSTDSIALGNDTVFMVAGNVISNTLTIDQFINGLVTSLEDSDTRLYIESGGLVWNNDSGSSNDAHGTFNVATGATAQISEILVDNTDTDSTTSGDFGWDGKTLTKTGGGTLTLSNSDNTYSGDTLVEGGTLVATNANALGADAAVILSAGTNLNLNFDGTGTNGTNFSHDLSGSGTLNIGKDATITQANTGFTGATNITGGTTTIQDVDALGSGTITNNSALVVDINTSGTIDNTLRGTGTMEIANGSDVAFTANNNNFSGATTIDFGASASMQNVNALGTGAIANDGELGLDFNGTFANSLTGAGNVTVSGTVAINQANTGFTGASTIETGGDLTLRNVDGLGDGNLTNDGTLTLDTTGASSYSNNVTGTGSLIKNGTGTVTLDGTNTYGGKTTINSGTLIGNIADHTALTVASGATYDGGGSARTVGSLNGGGTVTMQGENFVIGQIGEANGTGDFSNGTLTDIGHFDKNGTGELTVGNGSDIDSFTLAQGTLNIAANKTLNVTGATDIVDGTILNITSNPSAPALTTGDLDIETTNTTLDVSGYTGTGKVVLIDSANSISGNFTTYLVGGIDQSGAVTLEKFLDGVTVGIDGDDDTQIVIETGGLVWNNTSPNTAHGTFYVATSYELTEGLEDNTTDDAHAFGWDGKTLTKTNVGTLILSANSTYTGGTDIEAGKVLANTSGALGTGGVDIGSTGTLNINYAGTLNNQIEGSGNLEIEKNLIVNSPNTGFSGMTTIKGGTTTLQNLSGLGTGSIVDNGTLAFNTSASGIFSNNISGTGGIVKNNTGTVTLNGTNNYSGPTVVNAGTLTGNIAEGTALSVAQGATYDGGDSARTVSSLNGAGTVNMQNQDLTVGIAGTATGTGNFANGTLSNVDDFTKDGTGNFTIGNADLNTLNLQGGTLTVASGKHVDVDGTATFGNGTTLVISAVANTITAGDVVIGTGTTLDVTGYTGTGTVVLIQSDNVIADDFATYKVAGTDQSEGFSINTFVDGVNIKKTDDEKGIEITTRGLVWNNTNPNSSHGTFNIGTSFEITSDLTDNTDDDSHAFGWDGSTLTKTGVGTLILDGDNTYTGGTDIEQGTVLAKTGTALGTGDVTLRNGTTVELDFGGNLNNTITGGGTIVKTGFDELTIGGTNTLRNATGTFRQENGTVNLQTNFGGTYVQESGVFTSTDGTRIYGDASFGGTVIPDGRLNVTGNLTLEDGSDYYVNLHADTDGTYNDQITANMIDIGDSTLHVNDVGVSTQYMKGKSVDFIVLHSTNGITGDFSDIIGINSLFTHTEGVVGDNYVITLSLDGDKPFDPFAHGHNTTEVVTNLNHGKDDPGLSHLYDILYNMTDTDIDHAVDMLRGTEITADARTMALWKPWRTPFGQLEKTYATSLCGTDNVTPRNIWAEGLYRDTDVSSDNNARSYDITRRGVMAGIDKKFGNWVRGGVAFSYGDPRLVSRFGRIESNDYLLALYGQLQTTSNSHMNAFVSYGWQDYDYTRYDFGGTYSGSYDGETWHASLEFVCPMHWTKNLTLKPAVAVDYQRSWTEGFTERGGEFNQAIRSGNLDQMQLRAGLNVLAKINQKLELQAHAQYAYMVAGDKFSTSTTTFVDATEPMAMNLRGVDLAKNELNAGIGGHWYLGSRNRTYVYGNYEFDLGKRSTEHSGYLGIATSW